MKKTTLLIFAPFYLALILITIPQGFAHAQTACGVPDATGAVIPCPEPPSPEPPSGDNSDDNNQGGNQDQPSAPVTASATPLSITDNDRETWAREGWTGKCSKHNTSSISNCVANHLAACKSDHGTASQSTSDDGTVSVTCKDVQLPPLTIAATPLPLSAAPTPTLQPEEGYLGQCTKADGDFAKCSEKFKCEDGLLVIKVDLYSGNGTVYDFYCIPHKSDLPIASSSNGSSQNWTGGCNGDNAGASLSPCLDEYAAACAEEGGEYSEWYDDDGAGVYCQNQSEANKPAPTRQPGPPPFLDVNGDLASNVPEWAAERFPWLGWGILAGILFALSVQGVRKYMANAKTAEATMESNRHKLMESLVKEDDNVGMQYRPKRSEVDSNNNPGDSEGFHRILGDSDGDAPPPPPPKK